MLTPLAVQVLVKLAVQAAAAAALAASLILAGLGQAVRVLPADQVAHQPNMAVVVVVARVPLALMVRQAAALAETGLLAQYQALRQLTLAAAVAGQVTGCPPHLLLAALVAEGQAAQLFQQQEARGLQILAVAVAVAELLLQQASVALAALA